MGKNAGENFHPCIEARFLCGEKVYSGIASSLSPRKMVIHAKLNFPLECQENFEVLIVFSGKRVVVPVRILKFVRKNYYYDAIEVEITAPPKEYLNFLGLRRCSRGSSVKKSINSYTGRNTGEPSSKDM